MFSPEPIKACVFDAYGTLFDLSGITGAHEKVLGRDMADALGVLWRRKQLEYSWLRSLMGRHADFWQVTGDALDFAMTALDLADNSLRAGLMESYLSPPADPSAIEVLESLRKAGLKTAILSNGSTSMLASAVSSAGLNAVLGDVFSVEDVGVFKPHPSVYQLACDRLDVEPRQVAFVTANGWDAAGASAFGFRVAWLNRAGLPRERLPAAPHAELTELFAFPDLLGL